MSKHIVTDKSTGERKCSCFKRCGGCQLEMSYEKQLEWKQGKADRMLSRFCKVNSIISMDDPHNYRNKVQTVFRYNQRKQVISGVYQASSGNLVAIDDCMLENKKSTAVIQTIKSLMKPLRLTPYDSRTDEGLIKHVLTRYAVGTGQMMVCIVTSAPIFPAKNNFVKALTKAHPEITTIVQNICTNSVPLTLGERQIVLYGKGFIQDELCGLKFNISSASFYQVNHEQTQRLYDFAVKSAQLGKNDTVFDAYCGTGTIGLICAGKVKKVIGAELNPAACKDAISNSRLNKIQNVQFVNCDASDLMEEMADKNESVDVVIMDPPRAGSDERFLNSLAKLAPNRVVYVSCKIETLERDLKILRKLGYIVKTIQPVDMFPHTTGIETVAVLYKDYHIKTYQNTYL